KLFLCLASAALGIWFGTNHQVDARFLDILLPKSQPLKNEVTLDSQQPQTGLQSRVVTTWPIDNQEVLDLLNSSGTHFERGEYAAALVDLRQAEKTAPDCPLIYAAEYRVLSALKRDDEVITACTKWIHLEPDNPFAWKGRAELYGITSNWEGCLHDA